MRYISIGFTDDQYAALDYARREALHNTVTGYCKMKLLTTLPALKAGAVVKRSRQDIMREQLRQWLMMPLNEVENDPDFVLLSRSKQRAIREAFDQHAESGADGHRNSHDHERAGNRRQRQHAGNFRREIKSGKRSEHENIAVRKIDEPQNAVNHRVADGDQREDGTEREAVDELLEEFRHGATVWTYWKTPLVMARITAGFDALRLASIVILPVTP